MNKIIEYLEKLDFSENEAKIYLILLKNGSMKVSDVAQKVQLNRTAAYGYIHNLLEKGVIAKSVGASNKVIANPPAQLHYLVEEKISRANVLKEQLYPIITTLNSSFLSDDKRTESGMRYFKGRKGIKAMYEEALKASEIRSYFNPIEIRKYLPENVDLFENKLKKNPKMKIYEIVEDSPTSRYHIEVSKITERHFWKFLPKDIKLTSNDILIYEGHVGIVNLLGPEEFHGSIVANKDYYNNSKQLFDLLWRFLPEPGPPFSK